MRMFFAALLALSLSCWAFAADKQPGRDRVHPHDGSKGHPIVVQHHPVAKDYHLKHGTKFTFKGKQFYKYKGWNHTHWTHHRWDARYGCYLYYDPYCSGWFYWCQPRFCYYPVEYNPCGYVFVVPTDANGDPCPDAGFDDSKVFE